GAVHQQLQLRALGREALEQRGDGLRIGYVADMRFGQPAVEARTELVDGLVQPLRRARDEDGLEAVAGEALGDREADAARGAGDECSGCHGVCSWSGDVLRSVRRITRVERGRR